MGLQATRFGAHRMAAASRLLPPFLQPPRALPLPRCRVLESSMGRVASELLSATWPEAPGRGLSTRATCEEGRSGRFDEEAAAPEQFSVINFYHLTPIPVPGDEVETHKGFVSKAGLDIKGRIYVSSQGINAQYSGPQADVVAYAEWLKNRPGFESLRWHKWEVSEHKFPRLRLQEKESLLQLAGGTSSLPLTDPSQRATPLSPKEWKAMLKGGSGPKPLLLDVRNSYEWDAGHFKGAARPSEENFCETPAGSSTGPAEDGDKEARLPAALKGADLDAPVMMYCTGGIRCDVYSAYLRQQGLSNLYTLEGGIINYLNHEGNEEWDGSLFVFDDRLAIGPSASGGGLRSASEAGQELPAAVPCQLCGRAKGLLPHMNCANVLCNKLFIACKSCREQYTSCCCTTCTSAPRLRFRMPDGSWTEKTQDTEDTPWVSRGDGPITKKTRPRVVGSPATSVDL